MSNLTMMHPIGRQTLFTLDTAFCIQTVRILLLIVQSDTRAQELTKKPISAGVTCMHQRQGAQGTFW